MNTAHKRICFNDLYKFNFRKARWHKLAHAPFKRRFAVSSVLFDKMIIHGGMDENDLNRNDVFMYSFANDTWTNLNDKIMSNVPALSMHSAVAVVTSELKNDINFDI